MLTKTPELSPAETALLYSAMLFFKTHSEEAFAHTVINDKSQLYKEFFRYTEQAVKDLMLKLFGETFVDEMDYIKHFNKHWIELQNNKAGKTNCKCETGLKDFCPAHDTFG